jgi:hypothetical protein
MSDADRLVDNVVHAAQRYRAIEQVAKEGDDTPKRAVTHEPRAPERPDAARLSCPGCVKQHFLVLRLRRKRLRQCLGALGGLLVQELAADLVTPGQLCHRLGARQDLERQVLALLGVQLMGCTTLRST